MKTFIAIIALFYSTWSVAAITFSCDSQHLDHSIAVIGASHYTCKDENGNRYRITIKGLGVGLYGGASSAKISCVGSMRTDLSNLGDKISLYAGANVKVGALVGLGFSTPFYGNNRACFIASGGYGLGASAELSIMQITRNY